MPWREGKEPPVVKRFISFNALLAVDYPAYSMVIWQYWQLKAVIDVVHCAIFDWKGCHSSLDLAFCLLSVRHRYMVLL